MHKLNIAHRDLKLENLLLDSNWRLKTTDFGEAKVIQSARPSVAADDDKSFDFDNPSSQDKKKIRGTFVGTPLYVSPEMLETSDSNCSSDLWALGIIVFTLLTG